MEIHQAAWKMSCMPHSMAQHLPVKELFGHDIVHIIAKLSLIRKDPKELHGYDFNLND